MSETVRQRLEDAASPVTDLFFTSHGWMGDVPAAIDQYDKWVATMATLQSDRAAARERHPGFEPLIIGLHWPSLPWGDETILAGGGAVLSAEDQLDARQDAYAARIADTPKARVAIRSILEAARQNTQATTLTPAIREAYATLFAESGLGSGEANGRPGSDQDGFDPDAIIAEAWAGGEDTAAGGVPGLLGFDEKLRDVLLMPLRQLSFWKMKDRARQFGETGGHDLLTRLQLAAPNARFHLMGHSFGCIVTSATVAGASTAPPVPRPVDSLFLVQGALSLWSYAADIPYSPGTPGYFHRILQQGLVHGPLITTRSSHDTAVGRWYPMGAQLKKQLVLGGEYPAYGGIGAFGIQGFSGAKDATIQSATFTYDFSAGGVYNLEASGIIRNGAGPSGAHCDIVHPEVAHVFWAAVLADQRMSSGTPAFTMDWSLDLPAAAVGTASEPAPPMPVAAPPKRGSTRPVGLLSPEAPPPRPSAPSQPALTPEAPQPQPSATAAGRWINAELEDHAPQEPLAMGEWYTLAFDVDVTQHASAIGSMPLLPDEQLFCAGIDEVLLTVQLDTTDFEVSDITRPLRLPRIGNSHKARFDISPKHDGPSTLKATIHKNGNFIHQMELTFEVGTTESARVQVAGRGRPPSAVTVVYPRDAGLSISPVAGGYDCVVWGAVSARARLPLQPAFLANAIDTERLDLMKVVMHQSAGGQYIFQTGIDIPDADRDFALKTMARAGALLFQKLFFGPGAGADSKTVGEFLRRMLSDRATRLKLQIVAESTPVPWGLLYLGDASSSAQLDWENFVGMRHVIEQIPLQNIPTVCDPVIASDKPQLVVSLNVNSGIDAQMGVDFVAQQRSFWTGATASRKPMRVTARSTGAEVMRALSDGTTDDQILYFYCHAESTGLTAPGGADASCIVLTDARITLADLDLDAPTTTQLRGNPPVFINACESAEMSPAFYDGFVPYFMAKGARGVVGTECKTPALFAAAWAKRFFERFLDGESLGEAFLGLRREFLERHGNPLGLLYAVHCDGDTQIKPAVAAVN
jgi:hypothetical protein